MLPENLLDTAGRLLRGRAGRPRQADLKRAVSTAYYAAFHALCKNSADSFIGAPGPAVSAPAWRQVYRSLEHRFALKQCQNSKVLQRFPPEVRFFADYFAELQSKRHEADYDPASRFSLIDAQTLLDNARRAIEQLGRAPAKDRRAFAAWVTVRHRA